MMHRLYIILLLTLTVTLSRSQDISRFEHFGTEDGLSQSSVYSILCDDNGFLWVGTMNGFNRFDGSSFKTYSYSMAKDRAMDGEPVVNGRVERIWADDNNFLWLETYDGRYSFFNQRTEKFSIIPDEKDDNGDEATAFAKISSGLLAVGTAKSGVDILQYNNKTLDYDRYEIQIIDDNERNVSVKALLADSLENLWISTPNGVYLLSSKQLAENNLEPSLVLEGEHMTGAVCESPSSLLFGTSGNGIVRYDKKTQSFSRFGAEYISEQCGIQLMRYIPTVGLIVATHSSQLFLFDSFNTAHELRYAGSGRDKVDQLYIDKYNNIWVTTFNRGATRIDPETYLSTSYKLTPDELITGVDQERPCFYEDRSNTLWIGLHGGGLLRYNRESDTFRAWLSERHDSKSIPSNIVQCITEDKAGNLWLGTGQYLGGLVRVVEEKRAFINYIPKSDWKTHTDNVVRSLYVDRQDHIWVGTKGGEICVYDSQGKMLDKMSSFKCTDGTTENGMPYCITSTKDGRIWIGTKGKGLFVSAEPVDFANIRLANIRFNHICRSKNSSLGSSSAISHDYIYSIAQDIYGNVWVASYGSGLFRINGYDSNAVVKCYNRENSNLLSDKVRYVMSDRKGGLWVASVGGVNHIKSNDLTDAVPRMEQLTYSSYDPSICYNDVCYIYQDADDALYFATMGGGLCRITTEDGEYKYKTYSTSTGLSNNTVYAVVQDKHGDLWISTESGLSLLDRTTESFETFNENRSLAFNNFSEATVASLKSGSIVFGGYLGFTVIDPRLLDKKQANENLVLTNLWVNNSQQTVDPNGILKESITYATDITLEHWQSNITVSYVALDFTDHQGLRYSYMLEGLDKDWNYVGNSDRAIYTNLSPGTYCLRVRHMKANGYWSEETRDLNITVLSPWWSTWWAIVLYVVLLLLITYVATIVYRRVNRISRALSLEKEVNNVKLDFFTNIAHEIRTPLTLIVSPIDTLLSQELPDDIKRQMVTIRRNSDRLLKLVSQLLEFRKIQDGQVVLRLQETDLGDFVRVSADAFTLMAQQKEINFVCDIQESMQRVWVDIDEMDTVIYNLLSNAFKFTDAGKSISLSVSQDEAYTYIRVADQGAGIRDTSPDVLFKRFTILSHKNTSGTGIGLSLSYELVTLHQGVLSVQSELDKGTTFLIKLKNGREHFKDDPHAMFVESDGDVKLSSSLLASESKVLQLEQESASYEELPSDAPSVLIVEDDLEIQKYVEKSLRSRYKIRVAGNGREALQRVAEESPDVIITDIMMPIMDGEELIYNIRSDFKTSHILIIALSARSSLENQIETYKVGADAYIPKPFNIQHVIAVTESLLRRRKDYVSRLIGLPVNKKARRLYDSASTDSLDNSQETEMQDSEMQEFDINISFQAKDEEFMRMVVEFAETHYKENPNIDMLAEHFHMSRTVFFNKVKGITGRGPLDFLRQIKFKIAYDMLSKGYSVAETAFEIGYTDTKYFSKLFKRVYGITPSQLKNKEGDDEEIEDEVDDEQTEGENDDELKNEGSEGEQK